MHFLLFRKLQAAHCILISSSPSFRVTILDRCARVLSHINFVRDTFCMFVTNCCEYGCPLLSFLCLPYHSVLARCCRSGSFLFVLVPFYDLSCDLYRFSLLQKKCPQFIVKWLFSKAFAKFLQLFKYLRYFLTIKPHSSSQSSAIACCLLVACDLSFDYCLESIKITLFITLTLFLFRYESRRLPLAGSLTFHLISTLTQILYIRSHLLWITFPVPLSIWTKTYLVYYQLQILMPQKKFQMLASERAL